MQTLELSNQDLFFIWDCVNDRRLNCLDLVENDPSLDTETVEDLMETAHEAARLQVIIEYAMEEE